MTIFEVLKCFDILSLLYVVLIS